LFYFLKFIFNISTLKRSKNILKNNFKQKKIQNFWKRAASCILKHALSFMKVDAHCYDILYKKS